MAERKRPFASANTGWASVSPKGEMYLEAGGGESASERESPALPPDEVRPAELGSKTGVYCSVHKRRNRRNAWNQDKNGFIPGFSCW